MNECIQPFLLVSGECSPEFADMYIISIVNDKEYYGSCTAEQESFYEEYCIDVDNPCNIHSNAKRLIKRENVDDNLISCLMIHMHNVEIAETFLQYGEISCAGNEELREQYDIMIQYVVNNDCPKELGTHLTQRNFKDLCNNYCKQFVEIYEEYCIV